MGVHVTRRLRDLGESLVLLPERFDPRRRVEAGRSRRLDELVDIIADHVSARAFAADARVLVLDTSHAFEGLVLLRHGPVTPRELGSAKRRLRPGDVIVSRLRPYLRQVAFVDEALFRAAPGGNEVCGSSEFFALRRRGEAAFPVAALVPFLLSEPVQSALAAGQEGGHHPRFGRDLLASLRVPEALITQAAETAARVEERAAAVRRALAEGSADVAAAAKALTAVEPRRR